jgi:hypothetical protein
MAEAIRFYWLRGETTLPWDAIPEKYRNPLRVCRSVVEAHAPVVVEQLRNGRFVAVAWESGGSISLILCHPNLAKGEVDTLLVNTMALPRVVLRLGNWNEAPDAVRLFLTAFGSEAASVDECVAARRTLAEWLAEHGQADMAATVRHFSTFPFGVRSDVIEVINIWRQVLVNGQKEQLDRFLDEIGKRFEGLGWSREPKAEDRLNRVPRFEEFPQITPHQLNRFYCWVSGQGATPRVMLCLNRATQRRVRGGTYDVLDGRAGISDLASEFQRILAEVIEPAAAAVGLEVAYPRLGPISRVGPNTEATLRAFAEAGDGQWPIPEHAEPLWRTFVLAAFREDVALKPEELTAWFVASGWEEPAASELTNRFYANVALIAEYEEAGRQPA